MKRLIYVLALCAALGFLFGAVASNTTRAVGPIVLAQNTNLDLSPNADGTNDLRALACNCPTATSLRMLNGAQRAWASSSYDNVTLNEAQGLNFGTSDFIPSEYDTIIIKTGSNQFYKLRTTGNNTSAGIEIEYDYLGSGLPPAPTANFTFTTYDITGFFTDTSSGDPSSWSWDFDDGTTRTWQNPYNEFPSSGTYNVCLTATNAGGSDTYCQNVTVAEVTSTTVAPGGSIDFDGDGTNDLELFSDCGVNAMRAINSAEYTFLSGDYRNIDLADLQGASYSSGQFCATNGSEPYIYQPFGIQTSIGSLVKYYTAENDGSGIRFVFEVLEGALPDPPVASFTASSIDIIANFTDTSSNDPTEWSWTFGDGGTSTSQNPQHIYSSDGTYNVCLIASNVGGDSTQTCNNITISYVTSMNYPSGTNIDLNGDSVTDLQTYTCNCPGAIGLSPQNFAQWASLSKSYDSVTGTDAQNASYGTSNFVPSSANYNEPFVVRTGTDAYVKVWAIENTSSGIRLQFEVLIGGGPTPDAPVASFTASPAGLTVSFTDTSSNTPTSWSWDFGDSDTSTQRNPSHTYDDGGTYNVCLTAANAGGSDQTCQNVTVIKPPTANFEYDINGLEVTFTDTSSESPTSWAWDFADGNSSTAQNPVHSFTNGGTYNVCLTATNGGGSDEACRSVTVVGPPVANFNFNPIGLTVSFTDTSTSSPTEWSWDFGDSGTSTEQNPSHTYADAGTFSVCLTATNASGSSSPTCQDVTVIRPPTASFTFSVDGLSVDFTDTSSESPTSWVWDFGDSNISALQNPSHTFADSGSYNVCLTATNAGGPGAQTCQNVTVQRPPSASFTFTDNGLLVGFTDTSSEGPSSWAWDFGDGNTSTQQNPSHTFAGEGTYNVCLTATNVGGSDQTCTDVSVYEPPNASFTAVVDGLTVQFTDTSTNTPTSWAWDFGDTNFSTQQNPSHTFATGGVYDVCLTVANTVGNTHDCQSFSLIMTPGNLQTGSLAYTVYPITPTFSWSHDSQNVSWYQIWLQDPSGVITQYWYEINVDPALTCVGVTCSATPDQDLTENGTYTWYIQAWNAQQTSIGWSAATTFTINVPTATAPTGLNVTGDLLNAPAQPTYHWDHDGTATWYQLYVIDSNSAVIIEEWFEVGNDITCNSACSVTPTTTLPIDDYQWWVQAWNVNGVNWSDPVATFRVGTELPAEITGLGIIGDISTVPAQPTYTWDHDTNATWYKLYLSDSAGTVIIEEWFEVGNTITCVATCSITPATPLGVEDYSLWVRGWNNAGLGAWNSVAVTFHVGPTLPAATTGIQVSGNLNISPAQPMYTWDHDTNATWYELYLSDSTGMVIIDEWFEVGNTITCVATCSITPATPLGVEDYSLWVRGWNDSGLGSWNATAITFIVSVPALGEPTGLSVDVNAGQPIFSWTYDNNSTWYELYLADTSGTVIMDQWFEVGNMITCTTTCSISPTGVLASGDYEWWVRGYNANGNGPWNSVVETFTVP